MNPEQNGQPNEIERLRASLQDAELVVGQQAIALRRMQMVIEQLQAQVQQLQPKEPLEVE